MNKIVISFMSAEAKPKDPDHLFAILDLKTEKLQWIGLRQLNNTNNFVHGMGTCYNGDYFCAGIIPIRERLASNILTINLKTGKKIITYLHFTKAIHGMTSLDNNRLLVNAAQNDCIIELCLKNGHVITEDLYHHFLTTRYWHQIRNKFCNAVNRSTNYRGPTYVDDHHHNNSVLKHNNNIYATMFRPDTDRQGTDDGGLMFDLISGKTVIGNLTQPHTAFIDSRGNACVCNSSAFTFIVKQKFIAELDGYTRGIYEDQQNKGYWIGISAYRKYNAKISRWIEKYRGDQPLKGARLQFVSYEGVIGRTIELAQYGKEIFDLLPFKSGKWN